jgi:5-methylcytosine-specific restriction endonuclease McrA
MNTISRPLFLHPPIQRPRYDKSYLKMSSSSSGAAGLPSYLKEPLTKLTPATPDDSRGKTVKDPTITTPKTKASIPKALREQVWLRTVGKKFESRCSIRWCKNRMNVWDFHVGHNIPESKGGTLDIHNLQAICSRCNLSMSDTYTITEWNRLGGPKRCWERFQEFLSKKKESKS